MIGRLRGTLLEARPERILLEAGGVGYEVLIPLSTFTALPQVGSQAAVFVHTHVREDALQLFGFATLPEKAVFIKLLAVSGIGPRMALNVLSGLPLPDLVAALKAQDTRRLATIPGVGKKLAERMAVELKEKVDDLAGLGPVSGGISAGTVAEDAVLALLNLGYKRAHAEAAVAAVSREVDPSDLGAILQSALRSLAR
jgi:Holliday junction DNA helicase RuvA